MTAGLASDSRRVSWVRWPASTRPPAAYAARWPPAHALEGWKLVFRRDAQGEMLALCPDCFGRLMPRLGHWMRDKRLLYWQAAAGGRLPR